MKDFELLPHTADIKIRVYGKSLKELFKHALIGMFQSIKPRAPECNYQHDRLVCSALPIVHEIAVESIDREILLVDFLAEALYLSDVHNEAYLDTEIHELTNQKIKATLKGVKVTGFEVVEIKAVTYHDLIIEEQNGVWRAEVVFDI